MTRPGDVIALLFGRGGSVALPGKNVRRILGRPSLHYPLLAASSLTGEFMRRIYLSTDNAEIRELAAPFGVEQIIRPPELASNAALLEDAIVHGFEHVERMEHEPCGFYLILLCNAVTLTPGRIREAYRYLRDDPSLDSVTTVSKWNMFSPIRARRINRHTGLLHHYVPPEILGEIVTISCDRDRSEDAYFCDNSFTLVRRSALARLHANDGPFKWMGNRIRFLEQMPGGGDVDIAWQVPVVEWWLREHGFTESSVPFEQACGPS